MSRLFLSCMHSSIWNIILVREYIPEKSNKMKESSHKRKFLFEQCHIILPYFIKCYSLSRFKLYAYLTAVYIRSTREPISKEMPRYIGFWFFNFDLVSFCILLTFFLYLCVSLIRSILLYIERRTKPICSLNFGYIVNQQDL